MRISVTNDSRYIISVFEDGLVRIWNIMENKLEAILGNNINGLLSVGITCDKKKIITHSYDNKIRKWNI